MKHLILAAIYFALQTFSKIIEVTKTERDHERMERVLFETNVPSWQVCHKMCNQFRMCEAINFIKSTKTCQILNSCLGFKDAIESFPSDVFYTKDWRIGNEQCREHQCGASTMCVPSLQSYTCSPLISNVFIEPNATEIPAYLNGTCTDKPDLLMVLKNIKEKYIKLPSGLCYGTIITISGEVKKPMERFGFSLTDGEDGEDNLADNLILYLDIRFYFLGFSDKLVFNSRFGTNGKWSDEQGYPFPTDMSQPFEISILCHLDGYRITINKLYSYEYPHRMTPGPNFRTLVNENDVTLTEVSYQYCLLS